MAFSKLKDVSRLLKGTLTFTWTDKTDMKVHACIGTIAEIVYIPSSPGGIKVTLAPVFNLASNRQMTNRLYLNVTFFMADVQDHQHELVVSQCEPDFPFGTLYSFRVKDKTLAV